MSLPPDSPVWGELCPPIEEHLELCPSWFLPRYAAAMLQRARGDFSAAASSLEGVVEDFPDKSGVRTDLAQVLAALDDPEGALELLDEEVELGSANLETLRLRALVLGSLLQRSISEDPTAVLSDPTVGELLDRAVEAVGAAERSAPDGVDLGLGDLREMLRVLAPLSAKAQADPRPAFQHPPGLEGALPVNGEARWTAVLDEIPEVQLPDWPPQQLLNDPAFARRWARRGQVFALHRPQLLGMRLWCPWPVQSWSLAGWEDSDRGRRLEVFLYPVPDPDSWADSVAKLLVEVPEATSACDPSGAWVDALGEDELAPCARPKLRRALEELGSSG